jgi:antitoxin component of MazEF toxin-antitoxin module
MTSNEIFYRKVQVSSNESSVSLVLPKKICEDLGIHKGDWIKVALQGKTIIVSKQEEKT